MLLETLRQVRRLKSHQLKEVIQKLELIAKNKDKDQKDITFEDLFDALTFCKFHFNGEGFYESMGEMCPCNCICINCEMIPENPIGIKMQEIGKTMGEENVMTEFIEKFAKEDNEQKEIEP